MNERGLWGSNVLGEVEMTIRGRAGKLMKLGGRGAILGLAVALLGALSGQVSAENKSKPDLVVLGGELTEIVYLLGQQHRMVARDTTSTYPASVMKLPDVGYVRRLSPEGVLSVAPKMIISKEGAKPVETIDILKAANVKFIEVPDGNSAEGVARKISIVGDALGVPDKAKALAAKVQGEIDAAANKAAKAVTKPKRVLFVLSVIGGKVMAGGRGTGADAVIKLAGGVNVMDSFDGYKPVSDEAIIAARPDVIMMMKRRGMLSVSDEAVFALPAIKLTPAGTTKSMLRVDGLKFLTFGPRVGEAVTELSSALYGE